jgi:hypothetical protein
MPTGMTDNSKKKRLLNEVDEDVEQRFEGVDPELLQALKKVVGQEYAEELSQAEEKAQQAEEKAQQAEKKARQAEEGKRQAEEGKQQAEEGKRQAEESLKKTCMITGRAFCEEIQWHENAANSPAHLHAVDGAGYKTVKTKDHDFVLADGFWEQPVYQAHEEGITSNEADVEDMILADLKSTLRALILSGELPADCMLKFRRQQGLT